MPQRPTPGLILKFTTLLLLGSLLTTASAQEDEFDGEEDDEGLKFYFIAPEFRTEPRTSNLGLTYERHFIDFKALELSASITGTQWYFLDDPKGHSLKHRDLPDTKITFLLIRAYEFVPANINDSAQLVAMLAKAGILSDDFSDPESIDSESIGRSYTEFAGETGLLLKFPVVQQDNLETCEALWMTTFRSREPYPVTLVLHKKTTFFGNAPEHPIATLNPILSEFRIRKDLEILPRNRPF